MANKIVYTADNEMPVCIHCDHISGGFYCEKYCGAEHGWVGYQRTEIVDERKGDGE